MAMRGYLLHLHTDLLLLVVFLHFFLQSERERKDAQNILLGACLVLLLPWEGSTTRGGDLLFLSFVHLVEVEAFSCVLLLSLWKYPKSWAFSFFPPLYST